MFRRTVSGIILILLSTSMLATVFNIQPAMASGTIYIRADGSIDPPTAPISTINNITYTFMGNISDSIVVERNNIIIDGAGYTLQGSGQPTLSASGTGLDLSGRSNVTIHDTDIEDFGYGLCLNSTADCVISGNNIAYNYNGIYLFSSSNNSIFGNNLAINEYNGIWLDSSSNNSISGNHILHAQYGIMLDSSSNSTITGNNFTNNYEGIELWDSSDYNSISGNNIIDNTEGIYLYSSDFNSILGNNITASNWWGIRFDSSSNSTITGNNIADNGHGIGLDGFCSGNKLYHNNFLGNNQQVDTSYANVWDDGYPSGGNYWSDYNGTDANHDGIGDTAYIIDANNTDHYPFMKVISEFPSLLILPLFFIATLLAVIVYTRKKGQVM